MILFSDDGVTVSAGDWKAPASSLIISAVAGVLAGLLGRALLEAAAGTRRIWDNASIHLGFPCLPRVRGPAFSPPVAEHRSQIHRAASSGPQFASLCPLHRPAHVLGGPGFTALADLPTRAVVPAA